MVLSPQFGVDFIITAMGADDDSSALNPVVCWPFGCRMRGSEPRNPVSPKKPGFYNSQDRDSHENLFSCTRVVDHFAERSVRGSGLETRQGAAHDPLGERCLARPRPSGI